MFDRITARLQSSTRPVDNTPFWEESSLELQHGLTVSEIPCDQFETECSQRGCPAAAATGCGTGH
jgi:hypothetical protein